MIYFIDDFLPEYILKETIKDLSFQDYEEIKTPGKSFWIQLPSQSFLNYVINRLETLENNKIENKQNNTLSEFINKNKEKPAKELSILVANKFPKTPKKVLADDLDISRNTFYRHIKK